jgi:hypothetical protein
MLVAFESAEPSPVVDDRELLEAEYQLLRNRAQVLGESLCELGVALQRTPELIVVRPRSDSEPAGNTIVLRTHPPTLLAIERLADQIRRAKRRLDDIRRRPASPES